MIAAVPHTELKPELQHRVKSSEDFLAWSAREFGTGLVMSTSFGIQSAITLHLASRVVPSIPVIWVDTGYLPDETHEYAETLTDLLGLNLYIAKSSLSPEEMERQHGRLWESDNVDDLNLYDRIRKVEPMQEALRELSATAWISGLRADQTDHRKSLSPIKRQSPVSRVYPILSWTSRDVYYYMREHNLPQHPLFDRGYVTVGDAHSSRPLSASDTDSRATRFRGKKQECGLHLG